MSDSLSQSPDLLSQSCDSLSQCSQLFSQHSEIIISKLWWIISLFCHLSEISQLLYHNSPYLKILVNFLNILTY